MIHVRARLFAMQREIAGTNRLELELADGAVIETAWQALVARFPALAPGRASLRFARNADYADPQEPLADGDEVAFIPPVSGGSGEAEGGDARPGIEGPTARVRPPDARTGIAGESRTAASATPDARTGITGDTPASATPDARTGITGDTPASATPDDRTRITGVTPPPPPDAPRRIIELREEPLPATLIQDLADRLATDEDGAIVAFVGRTRVSPGTPAPGQEDEAARHAGRSVDALDYEAHDTMALRHLDAIADEIAGRFGVTRLAIVHRIGRVALGEVSIVVVAASPHRDAAFDAARYAIDETKARVPIWKAELFADGHVWIGAPPRTGPER